MNLYMLRHASAGTSRVNPTIDGRRPVDKDGKRHLLQLAQVLNSMQVGFDLILSSPLKRSLQSAQMIATETGYESGLLHSNALAPTGTIEQFHALLRECSVHENVLVVGHNPNLTNFLAALLALPTPAAGKQPPVRLRKGTMARVTLSRDYHGTLQWLIDARLVRGLYTTSVKSSRRKTSRK